MLLIDSGNSAIKSRLATARGQQDRVFGNREDRELLAFDDYLQNIQPGQAWLASVSAADVTARILEFLAQRGWQVNRLLSLPSLVGLTNGYRDPAQLGVDRWLCLLGAMDFARQDLFVVDAGSAITIDMLRQGGDHLGGAILPGLNTGRDAFERLFPSLDFSQGHRFGGDKPGRSTRECIRLSEHPTDAVQVNDLLNAWRSHLREPLMVLLTGQDAPRLAPLITLQQRVVGDLVFRGMLKQIHSAR